MYLLDILLKQPERQPLVQLDLLGVPLALQAPMMGQNVVDDSQHMGGPLRVVGGGVFGGTGVGLEK